MATQPLILVDGSSYLYRAYHAMPALSNDAGEPTGAIYGVVNMLRKLARDYPESPIAVVFDAPGRTFRDDLYAAYKATRPPMPGDLSVQVKPLQRIIEAMGHPLLVVEGVEADDVIGTLAAAARSRGESLLVSTGDKDMAQLVDRDCVHLLNTMSGEYLDAERVRAKFGVAPEQIIDYLALVGDSADNIPGIPKVGPKTAAKWLADHGSLDALLAAAESVRGKIGESLREHAHQLPMCRDLVTIRTDCELPLSIDDLRQGREPDRDTLAELYRHYGFMSWLREVTEAASADSGSGDAPGASTAPEPEIVRSPSEIEGLVERLLHAPGGRIGLEVLAEGETVIGIALVTCDGMAAYLPAVETGSPWPDGPEALTDLLNPLFSSPGPTFCGHRTKWALHRLRALRLVPWAIDDVTLMAYALNPAAGNFEIDRLALKHLGRTLETEESVLGKGAKRLGAASLAAERAAELACGLASASLDLAEALSERLAEAPSAREIYEGIERPLLPVLARMEAAGVQLDTDVLAEQTRALGERARELEAKAAEEAGGAFNLASPKQLAEVLFERLKLPVIAKTPKGAPSTAEATLSELAARGYPLPELIMSHRHCTKLINTYTDKLPRLVDERSRLHTTYQQAVTATGRLSSTEPNLQNIPIRTADGRAIRRAFTAASGCSLIAADYSQIELRIMAHLSGDETLIAAFRNGEDVHRATAAEILDKDAGEVSSDERRAAKAINFGLIYGMSEHGLARELGIARGEANAYIERYFERYPGVARYMSETREQAREQGFVETLFGRRLYLPDIHSKNPAVRQYAERSAINAPMQGTAADIIKRAMIELDHRILEEPLPLTLTLQVHDELVLEAPTELAPELAERVREIMTGVADLAVPLDVEAAVGNNWEEAH